MLLWLVNEVIVSQKGYNGDGKLHFFGWDYNFTHSLCAKIQTEGNILHCTKKTKNKIRTDQWRLLLLLISLLNMEGWLYLDWGKDPSKGSGSEQEDRDSRQLTSVTLSEVGDGLDQFAYNDHRDICGLKHYTKRLDRFIWEKLLRTLDKYANFYQNCTIISNWKF